MNRRNLFSLLFGALASLFVRRLPKPEVGDVIDFNEDGKYCVVDGESKIWIDYPPKLGTVAQGQVILVGSCTLQIHKPYER